MTKHIHVINGDGSNWKVKVMVQDQEFDLRTMELIPDSWRTVETLDLNNPGQVLTKYLTNSRRIVIEENGV